MRKWGREEGHVPEVNHTQPPEFILLFLAALCWIWPKELDAYFIEVLDWYLYEHEMRQGSDGHQEAFYVRALRGQRKCQSSSQKQCYFILILISNPWSSPSTYQSAHASSWTALGRWSIAGKDLVSIPQSRTSCSTRYRDALDRLWRYALHDDCRLRTRLRVSAAWFFRFVEYNMYMLRFRGEPAPSWCFWRFKRVLGLWTRLSSQSVLLKYHREALMCIQERIKGFPLLWSGGELRGIMLLLVDATSGPKNR